MHISDIWNPHAPDNMLERHRALQRGKAAPETFAREQKRITGLARKRRGMFLPEPTEIEMREFYDAHAREGYEGPLK